MLTLAFGLLAAPASAVSGADPRTPLAEIDGETIYVEDVRGALAMRIFKHELDIYSLLVSEAEKRIEATLLETDAKKAGLTVEALLARAEGPPKTVSETEVDAYLASQPGADGGPQARERVRHYLTERVRLDRRIAYLRSLRERAGAKILLAAPESPRTELDLEGAPARGPATADVVIVHFSTFSSRLSGRSARKLERLRKQYPDQIRQVHRTLLNDRDEVGLAAARIATVAAAHEKFWPFHDLLFANEKSLSIARITEIAEGLGLPADEIRLSVTAPETLKRVKRDIDLGLDAGAPREPSLYINGRFISGLSPFDEINQIVKEEVIGR